MARRRNGLRQASAHQSFGSRTDIGCVRDHNEDSLVVAPPLYAVADGMGGHAAGEVASEVAIRSLQAEAPSRPNPDQLEQAVIVANHAVIDAARQTGRYGMGTTLTAAMLEEDKLVIAQVGDSRAYLLHDGKLQQLTRDHSLVADMVENGELTPDEARVHPSRSVITRALSNDPDMRPDLYEITVEAGDRLMLCSDGLSSMVDHDTLETMLSRIRDPQHCANTLVNKAIAAGGFDNITVIVTDVAGDVEAQQKHEKKVVRKSRRNIIMAAILLVLMFAIAGFALNSYVNNAGYLINENGKVSVYRGLPDKLFGIDTSRLEQTTDIQVDKLEPGIAKKLDSGITVNSMDEANSLLNSYRQQIQANQQEQDEIAQKQSKAEKNSSSSSSSSSSNSSSSSSSSSSNSDYSSRSSSTSSSDNSDSSSSSSGTSYRRSTSTYSGGSSTDSSTGTRSTN